jgi:hypothetical protein
MTRVSEGFETFFSHTCFYINLNTLYLLRATAQKSFEILAQTNTPRDMTSDTEGASLERQMEFMKKCLIRVTQKFLKGDTLISSFTFSELSLGAFQKTKPSKHFTSLQKRSGVFVV